jgi:AcrR family transcriptional regulator
METNKKSDPRERILDVANRLFYTEGVRATGTEKIMSISEVAKATFYRHFESKDALVLAYLDHRDRSFWQYLFSPAPPETIQEALLKIERLVNHPEVTGCPFLQIASEYPDTAHPFHTRAIGHKDKLRDYLADLLKPHAIDKKAAAAATLGIIDGALSTRMLYGTAKKIPLLAPAEAVLKSFQRTQSQRRKGSTPQTSPASR